MRQLFSVAIAVAVCHLATFAASARADVPPPYECGSSASVGTACSNAVLSDGGSASGTCQEKVYCGAECQRYGGDAGTTILECVAGPASSSSGGSSSGAASSSGSSSSGGASSSAASTGGCSSAGSLFGPWMIALLAPLLFWRRRRA
jgi:Synergist-CTERM protein sorting domain-containing protein